MAGDTYYELFQENLEERLRAGGDPDYMVALVKIYEKEGEDQTLRHYAFREWVLDTSFKCGKCGARFRSETTPESEWDSVLCARCARKSEA